MRNIIVCADGTWNRPEKDLEKDHATNVLKVARAITPTAGRLKQQVFYDWGLGSYHSSIGAGITGSGIHKNILDGYRYIVQNYTENDRIFLFGFSRGAYTVRALCGLINNCGIIKRDDARLIEEAWKLYKSGSKKAHPEGARSIAFRKDHCYEKRDIHFVGVWDTVGALGVPITMLGLLGNKDEFYDTKMGANVRFARHALAIDEQREDFKPTIWTPNKGVDLKQVWFAGVHSDIGGSYGPDKATGGCVSDIALDWMVREAEETGLKFEPHLRKKLTNGNKAPLNKSRNHVFRFKRPLHRKLTDDVSELKIHKSVKVRYMADKNYRPKELVKILQRKGWIEVDIEV